MPEPALAAVARHLRERVAPDPTDRELLRDFTATADPRAFAAIVHRHGPHVLDVCRHVLRHAQDAEDAFQATFLVLARRAGSIRQGASLASWLHGVAYHMATKARRDAARRRAREARVESTPPGDPGWLAAWREVQAVLDEEIARLPEKYRAPFLLCILQGQSRAEAARELGLKEGTVWSRLSQARRMLQERLAHRGVTLSAILAVGDVFPARTTAPVALLDATARAAVEGIGLSGRVHALAEGALKTMTLARARLPAVLLLACGLLAAGAGLAAHQAAAIKPPQLRRAGPPPRSEPDRDPLPAGAQLRLGSPRLRHDARHGGLVRFSADGKTLVSAHGGGVVHVWDSATGKEVRSLKTLRSSYAQLPAALSPEGTLVALPAGNGYSIWDLKKGRELQRALGQGTPSAPSCLAFSADGRWAATGSSDGIRLWDVATGIQRRRFEGHRATVIGLAFSPGGRLLASKGRDGQVILWDTGSGKVLHQVKGNPDLADDLAWSAGGKTLALGQGKAVVLLDAATGVPIRRLDGLPFSAHALTFSPDGQTVAAAYGGIHLWQAATGKLLGRIDPGDATAGWLCFSPDGNTLATTGRGSRVHLWDVATGKERLAQEGHSAAVACLSFSPDGRLLATAGDDPTLRIWNARTGRQVQVFRAPAGTSFQSLLFTPDGKRLFSSGPNGPVREWDLAAHGQRLLEVQPDQPRRLKQVLTIGLAGGAATLRAIARSRSKDDEATILSTWDLQTGKQRVVTLGPVKGVGWTSRLSPDGTLFARLDQAVHVCDAGTGLDRLTLHRRGETVVPFAFSADNQTLAGISEDPRPERSWRSLVVWELATGRQWRRLELGRPGPTWGSPVAFSPDGRFLAAGGEDDTPLRRWDLATGKELLRLEGQQGSVTSLAFSPDGRRLAGGLRTGVALVWGVPRAPALPSARLEQSWADFADEDPVRARQALWKLTATPGRTVAFLADRLRPVPAVTAKDLARLVADLDSEQFAAREAASRELEKLGPQAEQALRQAVAGRPSAELRRRVKPLLADPGQVRSTETARRLRAIGALEAIGSNEARRVLKSLSTGAPAAFETRAARAALERLAQPATRAR